MAAKSLSPRKQPRRKNSDKALRKFIFAQMVSIEAGGAKGYGPDLVNNMDVVYKWIMSQPKPHVVVDNCK